MLIYRGITVPDSLISKLVAANGEAAKQWIELLPDQVSQAMTRWQLTDASLLHAGVESVVLAVRHDQQDCVLKLMVEERAFLTQAQTLIALNASDLDYVPRVLDTDRGSHTLLMQQVRGTHPTDPPGVDASVRAVLGLLKDSGVSGSDSMEEYWADRTERSRARCRSLDAPSWQCEIVEHAHVSMLRLMKASEQRSLLHGDLHLENMLLTESGKVVLIDFWGLDGDPYFDTATWVVKTSHLLDDSDTRIKDDTERAWVAALLPSQAISLQYYDAPPLYIERIWAMAQRLSDLIS